MIPISTVLGGIAFVALAALGVTTMMETLRPTRTVTTRNRLIAIHRLSGYLFLALFIVMLRSMVPRLIGTNLAEVPPDVLIHVMLVLALFPLLALKVLIARRYKHLHSLLAPLGLIIFAVSFVTVALPSFSLILRSTRPGVSSIGINLILATTLGTLACGYAIRGSRRSFSAPEDHEPLQVEASSTGTTTLMLSTIKPETHDTKTLRFVIQGGKELYPKAGQFMMFQWMIKGKRVPRSYTISSSPTQIGYLEITPKRIENGCVSQFLHDEAKPGLIVEASGPYGTFYFDESTHRNIVLIAGGSGITPMMSMLRYINELRLPTVVTLLYCVRRSKDIIFGSELEKLRSCLAHFNYVVVLSKPDDGWKGHSGYLTQELIMEQIPNLNDSTFFLCGPQGFMDKARELLTSVSVDQNRIHQESFGSSPASTTQPLGKPTGTVEFAHIHKKCAASGGSTLLEVAEANGISVPFSCRQGQCGTCAMRVLRGTVHMETNQGLTREQIDVGYVLPCVSRADGAVVLGV